MFSVLENKSHQVAALLTLALISMPFLGVDWLPMTDLPHHLAQGHLLVQALAGHHPELAVHWLSPNSCTTWLLAGLSPFLPTPLLAKLMVAGLLALSVVGVALLARKVGASATVIPLAAMVLFNQSFYWGFLPFMAGFVASLLAILTYLHLAETPWKKPICLALLFIATYFCHVLWLAVSLLAIVLEALFSADRVRRLRGVALAVLPALILTGLWYPSMQRAWADGAYDLAPLWSSTPLDRLSPGYAAFCLSGLQSDSNGLVLLAMTAFALFGTTRVVLKRSRMSSPALFALALALLAAYFFLPDKHNNTILFSMRWLPYQLIFLLLACLAPLQTPAWKRGMPLLAFLALTTHIWFTTQAWQTFDKKEMSGLTQALASLPLHQKVLELDFVQRSPTVNTPYPFAAIAAYAQPMRDAELNFSFAEQPTSLVTYKLPPDRPYQLNLNLMSQRVTRDDVVHFDFALIDAKAGLHSKVGSALGVTPITREGRWRLYAVTK